MRFALVVLAVLCSTVVSALTLVKDGKSDYTIVLPADASPSQKHAADELQHYLEVISGAKLPIAASSDSQHQIKLETSKGLGDEGYRTRTYQDNLIISGSPVRGTMYGVYGLLDRLGVRWFTSKIERVPKIATIELPAIDEVQIPAFEYREPNFKEAMDRNWAARNRVNGAACDLDASVGGKITYFPFVHSFEQLIPPSLYKDHPEYFPLVGGKRKNGYVQRCLSNPDVLKLAIAKVQEWIKDHPEAMIYSVSQNDCGDWCQCDKCQALIKKYGSISGEYIWFVNQIAEAIEKDHPDKLIDTLAYQFTEAAPKNIAPRKNVRVRLCPIYACEAHPYAECGNEKTKNFMKALGDWGAITNTLYIWHYNTDFANYLMPFPDFNEFPADLKLYKNMGVKGVFFEGAYNTNGASDAELRSYVMAKCLWNENEDAGALVTEWMQGVYGDAWKPMRQWFDLLHETVRDPSKHFFIYDNPGVYFLAGDTTTKGDQLFDEAEKLATKNDVALHEIMKARLCLRFVKIAQHGADNATLDQFAKDCKSFGITLLTEGWDVDTWINSKRKK
jgi:hypothetical protein